jgi:hypothetical protein
LSKLARHSSARAIPPAHFALVILEIVDPTFCPGVPGLRSSYFELPTIDGMTSTHHTQLFFPLRWRSPKHFCLGQPWTKILLILASQVARIIGISFWHQAKFPLYLVCLFFTLLGVELRASHLLKQLEPFCQSLSCF